MKKKAKKEIVNLMKPKKVRWRAFEDEVATFFEKSIPERKWGLNHESAHVRRKPKYYSNSRKSHIIFDVSVEVHAPGTSDILLLWLIECKDYPRRKVKVDEIEEFHKKMEQVGAHKGTVVTRKGFDTGSKNYAETHRIGLAVLNKQEIWSFAFSATGGAFAKVVITPRYFLDDQLDKCGYLEHLVAKTMRPFNILIPPVSLTERRILFSDGNVEYVPVDECG